MVNDASRPELAFAERESPPRLKRGYAAVSLILPTRHRRDRGGRP
jgi:hypothetical protein